MTSSECSIYLAHDHLVPVPAIVFSNLVRDYAIGDILLGGDANVHYVIWGSSDINIRGELLYDYILSNNIYVCNKGNDPTFIIKNRSEALDINLACSTKPFKSPRPDRIFAAQLHLTIRYYHS